jgi:hypothetical protein
MVQQGDRYLRNLEEVWEILLKIVFGFPGSFFFSMMIPLDLEHPDCCSSGTSFLGIYDFDWMLVI